MFLSSVKTDVYFIWKSRLDHIHTRTTATEISMANITYLESVSISSVWNGNPLKSCSKIKNKTKCTSSVNLFKKWLSVYFNNKEKRICILWNLQVNSM